jgi:hypothetical protein
MRSYLQVVAKYVDTSLHIPIQPSLMLIGSMSDNQVVQHAKIKKNALYLVRP